LYPRKTSSFGAMFFYIIKCPASELAGRLRGKAA